MSDIPLRYLRRNQARPNYISLADNDAEPRTSPVRGSSNPPDMSTTSIARGVVVNGNMRRSAKATGNVKGKDRYVDDPEEEERLLGGSFDDGSGEGDEAGEPSRPSTRVCYSHNSVHPSFIF